MNPSNITPEQFAYNQRFLKDQSRFALERQILKHFLGKTTIAGIYEVVERTLAMIAAQKLYENQKFLNAEKKTGLLKKAEILDKIDRLTQPPSPKNIISALSLLHFPILSSSSSSSSEPKMIHGGIETNKNEIQVVNNPSNISFNTLKRPLLDTPVNITPVHKR